MKEIYHVAVINSFQNIRQFIDVPATCYNEAGNVALSILGKDGYDVIESITIKG